MGSEDWSIDKSLTDEVAPAGPSALDRCITCTPPRIPALARPVASAKP